MNNRVTAASISLWVLWAFLTGCPVDTPEEATSLDTLVASFWSRVVGTEEASLYFLSETQVLTGDTFKAYTYQGNNTGTVTGLGDFTLSPDGETLILSGGPLFTRQPDRIPDDTLVSTRWIFGNTLSLEFTSPNKVKVGSGTFTYDPATRKGEIEYVGPFIISSDGMTLHFTNYGGYGHGATFIRRD
ncbi:MAG: hypothetical protein LBD93_07265 [Treponema sp.]|jgi:hypothetical protein|nr:hypothetical protein [Treponema sp.]